MRSIPRFSLWEDHVLKDRICSSFRITHFQLLLNYSQSVCNQTSISDSTNTKTHFSEFLISYWALPHSSIPFYNKISWGTVFIYCLQFFFSHSLKSSDFFTVRGRKKCRLFDWSCHDPYNKECTNVNTILKDL